MQMKHILTHTMTCYILFQMSLLLPKSQVHVRLFHLGNGIDKNNFCYMARVTVLRKMKEP